MTSSVVQVQCVWHKIKNISVSKEAMLLKLGRDVAPYEMYQMVHILMLLWQHAQFQSLSLKNQIFNNYPAKSRGISFDT